MTTERYSGELADIRANGYVPCMWAVCIEITGPSNPEILHRDAAYPLWECEQHTPTT